MPVARLGGKTELPDLEVRWAAYPGCLPVRDLPHETRWCRCGPYLP